MTLENRQYSDRSHEIERAFDEALSSHIERLIGVKNGIGALSLNLVNISCLILLMEHENAIGDNQDGSLKRFSIETLAGELDEIGIGAIDEMNRTVRDLVQKGYVHVNDEGGLLPQKPAGSIVQLINRAFQKMPGMNLVAYLIQTMDEVKSGRKGLGAAINQFDQTLAMQGVSLIKEKKPAEPAKTATPHKLEPASKHKGKHYRSTILSTSESKILSEKPGPKTIRPTILSSNPDRSASRIREIRFGQVKSKEEKLTNVTSEIKVFQEPEKVEENIETTPEEPSQKGGPATIPNGSLESPGDLSPEPGFEIQVIDKDERDVQANFTEDLIPSEVIHDAEDSDHLKYNAFPIARGSDEKTHEEQPDLKDVEDKTKKKPDTTPADLYVEMTDDVIEKRITNFEQELASECPICRRLKIRAEETSTGKTYYKCSSQTCNFISWGMPYHVVCPKCENPFLIEVVDRKGKTILECPRATCRYWQLLPGDAAENPHEGTVSVDRVDMNKTVNSIKPKRKVVKKRRVRRKR